MRPSLVVPPVLLVLAMVVAAAALPDRATPVGTVQASHDAWVATDPAGDSPGPPSTDLVAAWFELDDGDVVARWQVAGIEGLGPASCYNLDFRVGEEYWVLFARYADGELAAAVRNDQFGVDERSAVVATGTHHVMDGVLPVEIEEGAPATLSVRYDAGAFPASAGTPVVLSENAWSCHGGNSAVDRIAAGAPYVLPADTWRAPGTGSVYTGLDTTLDACSFMEVREVGWTCHELRAEDRGSAYVLTTSPPVPVSKATFFMPVAFTFEDESGRYYVYGEPGGFPRFAARFSASSLVPLAEWRIETV